MNKYIILFLFFLLYNSAISQTKERIYYLDFTVYNPIYGYKQGNCIISNLDSIKINLMTDTDFVCDIYKYNNAFSIVSTDIIETDNCYGYFLMTKRMSKKINKSTKKYKIKTQENCFVWISCVSINATFCKRPIDLSYSHCTICFSIQESCYMSKDMYVLQKISSIKQLNKNEKVKMKKSIDAN